VSAPPWFSLLERLAAVLDAELRRAASAAGLNAAQVAVLRYLDKANQYSNTPSAVAAYFGLTKGTVSQTLLALERGGWLRRATDPRDRRIVRLALTRRAQALVARLTAQLAAVPAPEDLASRLESLLKSWQQARGGLSFGVCRSCRYFLVLEEGRFQCGLTGEPLLMPQPLKICHEHLPAA
jgi:DNA-binding MarR family transcriptional regulator